MKNQKGFKLIELLVVVAIVGVLAAIAIPQFQEYKYKAYDATSQTLVHNGKVDVEAYISQTGSLDNISADKRWNIGANAPSIDGNDDVLLPTAKISEGFRLRAQVSTYQCTGDDEVQYLVQAIPFNGDKRWSFWNRCNGNHDTYINVKSNKSWWG